MCGPPECTLATGLIEYPSTDIDDLARLLEDRYELVWRDDALLGMLPPDQRFDARDLTAVKIDDRLVLEEELLLLDRGTQFRSQLEVPQGSRPHFGNKG